MSTASRSRPRTGSASPAPSPCPSRWARWTIRVRPRWEAAALPTPHDISGLIAWSKREEWRGALAALIERHCAGACAGAGIAAAEIEDVLGDHAATVLWGAAFEDLLATDLPDGRNVADDYLRRRGWKEGASTRDHIAGLRRSAISLYEVSGLVPGRSMRLRDLIRGGEPARVSEERGSEGLRRWDRVATRVVPLRDGGAVIGGTLMLFEHEAGEALLASLRRIRTKAPRDVAAAAATLRKSPKHLLAIYGVRRWRAAARAGRNLRRSVERVASPAAIGAGELGRLRDQAGIATKGPERSHEVTAGPPCSIMVFFRHC